jgi:hypothetical protein
VQVPSAVAARPASDKIGGNGSVSKEETAAYKGQRSARVALVHSSTRSARSEPSIVEARAPLVFTALSHGPGELLIDGCTEAMRDARALQQSLLPFDGSLCKMLAAAVNSGCVRLLGHSPRLS